MDPFKRMPKEMISNRVNLIEIHSVNINQNERQNECFHSNTDHKALTAVIKIPSNNSIGICHFEKKKTFCKEKISNAFIVQYSTVSKRKISRMNATLGIGTEWLFHTGKNRTDINLF